MAIIQHPVDEKDKVRYALAGVGDHYKIFVTSMTTRIEFPSFDELRRHLVEYEALYPSNSSTESSNYTYQHEVHAVGYQNNCTNNRGGSNFS